MHFLDVNMTIYVYFFMTFQDCLIKWLSKVRFYIHLVSVARESGGLLKLTIQVLMYTGQKLVDFPQNMSSKFHDFP